MGHYRDDAGDTGVFWNPDLAIAVVLRIRYLSIYRAIELSSYRAIELSIYPSIYLFS